MAESTGIILAVGAGTMVNESVFQNRPIDWRVPIATGFAAGIFALGERAWPGGVVGLAWLALISTLFVRIRPGVPSPIETALTFWEGTR